MRCTAAYAPHAERQAQSAISLAMRRVDRRSDEGGPFVQPLGRMGLLRSMLDWPARRARDALGCIVPLPRAGRYGRRTWLGEARVLQLTKVITALSPLGDPGRGRSDARASTVPSV